MCAHDHALKCAYVRRCGRERVPQLRENGVRDQSTDCTLQGRLVSEEPQDTLRSGSVETTLAVHASVLRWWGAEEARLKERERVSVSETIILLGFRSKPVRMLQQCKAVVLQAHSGHNGYEIEMWSIGTRMIVITWWLNKGVTTNANQFITVIKCSFLDVFVDILSLTVKIHLPL